MVNLVSVNYNFSQSRSTCLPESVTDHPNVFLASCDQVRFYSCRVWSIFQRVESQVLNLPYSVKLVDFQVCDEGWLAGYPQSLGVANVEPVVCNDVAYYKLIGRSLSPVPYFHATHEQNLRLFCELVKMVHHRVSPEQSPQQSLRDLIVGEHVFQTRHIATVLLLHILLECYGHVGN